MEKELLLKILELSYEISTTTKADVFFYYSPHTNTFDLNYHKEGWQEDEIGIYIALNKAIDQENLQEAIKQLEKLKEEVKLW